MVTFVGLAPQTSTIRQTSVDGLDWRPTPSCEERDWQATVSLLVPVECNYWKPLHDHNTVECGQVM